MARKNQLPISPEQAKELNQRQKAIATRLIAIRKRLDLTQSRMASEVSPHLLKPLRIEDISFDQKNGTQFISQLENRNRSLTFDIAIAYSKVGNVSVDYILGLTDTWRPEHVDLKAYTHLSDEALANLHSLDKQRPDDIEHLAQDFSLASQKNKFGYKFSQWPKEIYEHIFGFLNYLLSYRRFIIGTAYRLAVIKRALYSPLDPQADMKEYPSGVNDIDAARYAITTSFSKVLDDYIQTIAAERGSLNSKQHRLFKME